MRRDRTLRRAAGERLLIRPISPADRALLSAALGRLSDTSRYQRFHSHRSAFTDLELDYLTDVDHADHEALIAIDLATGDAVGVARYVRTAPATAELAVTVVDDWQRQGVGTRLLRALARRARRAGIDRFVAVTVAGNEPALRLLDQLGGATRSAGDTHLELAATIPPAWKRGRPWRARRRNRRLRRIGRQTLKTVQALTPGAP
jgi:RimJ/RimL family protein N-acetyltransferase